MPLLRRPAAFLRRPAAASAPLSVPLLAPDVPTAFDVAAWELKLDLGAEPTENARHVSTVYLVTFSRVLAATLAESPQLRDPSTLTREQVRDAVWDSLENPIQTVQGGRRREANQAPLVLKLLVVKEKHEDGTYHFHVAVKLKQDMRFLAAKRTLFERHGLVSHWSSTHTQWWSALRYCVYTNPPKKLEIDKDRLSWNADGVTFDVFREAQESFQAKAWTKRREAKDVEAPAKNEHPSFTKLDFNALVAEKGLKTKKRLLAYVQDYGTAAEQAFCAKHQRRIQEYLEDAEEWASARAAAALETKSDWDIVCAAADTPCPQGATCVYAQAARAFFLAHRAGFSETQLAVSLRAIIIGGPSKERRVPFLVGNTNTGKSTIVEPFDDVFGEAAVFHLPAETDNKGGALRGWLHDKRFVFWDEFEPLVFIAKGVMPKSQFLKAFNGQLFEVQLNQRTNDGNKPFRWNRGAVFTAKDKELWKLREGITAEDVTHIKSRVEIFRCTGSIDQRPGGVPKCAHCLAKWVRDGAAQHDANAVQAAVPSGRLPGTVYGLQEVLEAASIPETAREGFLQELLAMGAIDVRELGRPDWERLQAWGCLREMERRRVFGRLGL